MNTNKTVDYLTKHEAVAIICQRAQQLEAGANTLLDDVKPNDDLISIAIKELISKKLDVYVEREYNGGQYKETYHLSQLQINPKLTNELIHL
jgi:DNA-directed RNA polymerase subunit K/omega